MYDIYHFLHNNNWNVTCLCADWTIAETQWNKPPSGRIDNIYAQKDTLVISVAAPHSGNDFRFLLRIDYAATHDRWSNCDFEEYFNSPEDLILFLSNENLERHLV